MPDPTFDPRQESMKFVGAASFEGDPICFGPNKTRPLPGGGSPLRYASDSDDSGKAVMVEGDTDVSGVTGKELMNAASSSSPICFGPNKTRPLPDGGSPLRYASDSDDSGKAVMVKGDTDVSGVTGKELMNAASSSSPVCFGPNGTRPLPGGGSPLRYASDSDDSGKAVVVEGDTDVSGVTGKELMNAASSSSPICFGPNGTRPLPGGGSPLRYASGSDDSGKAVVVEGDTDVSGVTGKELMNAASFSSSSSSTVSETPDMRNNLASDEAEDTTDVPEASMRSLAITPMNESDDHLYWRNREPRLFEDTAEQTNIGSGLGCHEIRRLMGLQEESQHDVDPHLVQGPEDLSVIPTTIVTFQVPSFSMGLAGGIVPFAEWQSVEDPDDVGLENLDIFMVMNP